MSTDQPRAFSAATSPLAYAQAFTAASVRTEDGAPRRRRGRRTRSILRSGHRTRA
jgi:hypothetical protein